MEYKFPFHVMVTTVGQSQQDIERDIPVEVREYIAARNLVEVSKRSDVLRDR